jgi:hypothetical protein
MHASPFANEFNEISRLLLAFKTALWSAGVEKLPQCRLPFQLQA